MSRAFEERAFVAFVIIVTLAMLWIVIPFYGAVLWALVAAILFWPIHHRISRRIGNRRNSAALLTVLLIIALVIVPLVSIGTLLIEEALGTYNRLQSQQINIGKVFSDVRDGLPASMQGLLERYGWGDMRSIERKLAAVLSSGLRLAATQALTIGQGAFAFAIELGVMLYLAFFFLRDGPELNRKIGKRVPLAPEKRKAIFEKFTTVIRATIKGSIVVAVIQGLIGGVVFAILGIQAALLWGVVMGFLSLLPAIGTGIVWVPVAIYLFATGSIMEGAILVGCGVLIIGMVDNVLRPILVGKDTRMPDFVVLVTTLGGISVFGINGFILGPVIAALFIAAWDIFAEGREQVEPIIETRQEKAAG
jgi:predicted PurR-regulated permease PerM